MRAQPALLRARAPYLIKNTITGFAIFGLVVGICMPASRHVLGLVSNHAQMHIRSTSSLKTSSTMSLCPTSPSSDPRSNSVQLKAYSRPWQRESNRHRFWMQVISPESRGIVEAARGKFNNCKMVYKYIQALDGATALYRRSYNTWLPTGIEQYGFSFSHFSPVLNSKCNPKYTINPISSQTAHPSHFRSTPKKINRTFPLTTRSIAFFASRCIQYEPKVVQS
jgi:hypothetical protein